MLGLIALACIFVPKFRELEDLQRRRDGLQGIVRAVDDDTRDLRLKQERFSSDPEYVERVAKDAGMIKTNEVLFKFGEDTQDLGY